MPKFGMIHYNIPGNLEEFLNYAHETGFNTLELQTSDVWGQTDGFDDAKRNAEALRKMLEARNLEASALAALNDFVILDEAKIEYQVQRMEKVCQLADILGTKILRTEGGWEKPEVTREQLVPAMAGCLKRCLEFVEPGGYFLAVDNHGAVTNDADLQVELYETVGSKNVGANLDTMNYRWYGHDLETINRFYKKIAPYVFSTHFKDGRGSRQNYVGTALGEGEINLEYAIACLKEAGYKGSWTVEYEGSTDPKVGYRKGLEYLKARV